LRNLAPFPRESQDERDLVEVSEGVDSSDSGDTVVESPRLMEPSSANFDTREPVHENLGLRRSSRTRKPVDRYVPS